MNWDKQIAKAERALYRNKAMINNSPTSHGTAASWSAPKYDLNKQIDDVSVFRERDRKRQRKAAMKGRPKRRRKRGEPRNPGRKFTGEGPIYKDPRTKELK
jgi:hypothetical protein